MGKSYYCIGLIWWFAVDVTEKAVAKAVWLRATQMLGTILSTH